MDKLHQQQAALEVQLADPDIYSDANRNKLKQLVLDKSNLDAKLEAVEMEWMESSEAYDTAWRMIKSQTIG